MNQELYQKLFARMDEIGAIRKDFSCGCEYLSSVDGRILKVVDQDKGGAFSTQKVIGHPPVLSDCILGYEEALQRNPFEKNTVLDIDNLLREWELSKPYLHQQTDELGEKLLTLLS